MKRVLSIVTNNFTHDSRVLNEGLSLCKAGFDVTVAALNNGQLPEHETIGPLKVHRIRLKSRKWSKNRIIQLFKYAEFFYRIAKHYRKFDFIHCNDVAPLPIGILIRTLFNRKMKIVYDAHELEFNKAEAGSNYYPQRFIALAERVFIHRADARMTVSPLIAKAYTERYNIPAPKVVMNCPPYQDQPESEDLFRKKYGLQAEQKIFLYQGGLIAKRGVEPLIEVFEQLDDQQVLIFLGFGPLVPLAQKAAAENSNIFYHEAVPPTELARYTLSGDYGFCLYQGLTQNHNLTIGNKIFQYIMAGIPVLASNLEGLKYVLEDGMGIVVEDHTNVEEVRKAILEIARWKKTDYLPLLAEAAKKYNWEKQEAVLIDIYKNLV